MIPGRGWFSLFTVIRDCDTIGSKAQAGRRRKYVCEILV